MTTTFCVEFDWDDNGTWTDESAYVEAVDIRSGFGAPGDPVAAIGRCTLALDNTTRRFSPAYAAGPLAGKLLPRRPVRVRALDGAQSWTLFHGWIEALAPTGGRWARGVTVEAVDGMALLANAPFSAPYAASRAAADAVADVVAAAYTPPATQIADSGDTLAHYGRAWSPERTTARAALAEICRTVYGRAWIARDGTLTTWSRLDQQADPALAALDIGGYWERVASTRPAHLRGYWRLNEAAGTSALDWSGQGRDGQVSGVTWGADGIGDGSTAAQLDGINDTIQVPHAALLPSGDFTLMLWLRVGDVAAWSDGVYRRAVLWATDNTYCAITRDMVVDNGLRFEYYGAGDGYWSNTRIIGPSTDWFHVAQVLRDGTWEVWVNGACVHTKTRSAPGGAFDRFMIGAHSGAGSNVWWGDLAHVALWHTALSAAELADLAGV